MAPEKQSRKAEITSNMEDYLEAIHEIAEQAEDGEARVKDIAGALGVTRPSVVGMLKHLAEHGLVAHDHYGGVGLTAKGAKLARQTAERHGVLRNFLEEVLGLDAEVAEEDACRMEHTLSPETIDRFVALEQFRREGPGEGKLRGDSFRKFLLQRKRTRRKPKK